jgi:hypothetical protein
MEYTLKQKNRRHEIKKQMNQVVSGMLKFSAIADRTKSEAVSKAAIKIVQRKEVELNNLWFEYRRLIPGRK